MWCRSSRQGRGLRGLFTFFETCSASSGLVAVVARPEQKRRDTRIGNNILLPIRLAVKVGTVKLFDSRQHAKIRRDQGIKADLTNSCKSPPFGKPFAGVIKISRRNWPSLCPVMRFHFLSFFPFSSRRTVSTNKFLTRKKF